MDWNDQKYAEVWRHSWETITNRYLEAAGRPERVDLRSFERQGVQQIPTVHLGPAAHQMEKRGVETFLGNLNRDIRAANSLMQSIRSAIRGLQRWIADLNEKKQLLLDALEKAKEPTLSDLLVDYFNLRDEQRSDWSGKAKLKCTVRDFEEVKRAVDYLKAHSLNTIEDLDTAISNLNQIAAPLRKQLKQNENRMRTIAQIKDAAAVHAKLKPIHDTFMPTVFHENLFDDFFDPFWNDAALERAMNREARGAFGKRGANMMKTDVKQTDNGYEVAVDLPGCKKEDVQMDLNDGYLTIQAVRSHSNDEKDKKGRYLRHESFSGTCARSFYVGDVKKEDIHAKFEDGVLHVELPAPQQTKALPENPNLIAIE